MSGVAAKSWHLFTAMAVRRPVVISAAFFVCLWGVLATAEEAATTPKISDVRLGVDGTGQTRIVFDSDARTDHVLSVLEGGAIRVTIRGATYPSAGGAGIGLVTGWEAEAETATLLLKEPALPVKSFVLAPSGDVDHFRLVIDLEPVDEATYAAAATRAAPVAARTAEAAPAEAAPAPDLAPSPSLNPARTADAVQQATSRALRASKTVVIDPGHGGYDPGASGPAGTQEEVATLSAAVALRTILQARGYEVILTREDDSFVELDERIEKARRAKADLFLSLHADGLDDPTVRGASVYTLADKRAGSMARELRSEGNFVVYDVALDEDEADVGDILFDLASSSTLNESGRLAALLVDELSGTIPLVHNSHRKKSLRVLLSPDVPAVLVELAFISNPEDEKNLASPRWRRRAMGAIADGIDSYFGAQVAQGRGRDAADG